MALKKLTISTIPMMIFLMIACGGTSNKLPDENIIRAKISAYYGLDLLHKLKSLNYTFNLSFGEIKVTREWQWDIHNKKVTYHGLFPDGNQGSYSYDLDKIDASSDLNLKIDQWFINDQYWLLFPMKLAEDKFEKVSVEANLKTPIKGDMAHKLTVIYPKVGYTPNDRYDVYFDKDYRILEWAWYKGNGDKPNRITVWEKEPVFNAQGLRLSIPLERNDPENNFKILFSNVSAE